MKKVLLTAFVLLSTSSALAQPTDEIDANYVFEDDPLSALSERERGPIIKTRMRFARTTLLRPRLHFVRELKKSVEDL